MIQKLIPRGKQVIGVTGNICSGKSFVLKYFSKKGFKIFSIDSLIHKAMQENYAIKQKISKIFPKALKDGNICRVNLGDIIFNNELAKQKLENILHPYTYTKIKEISKNIKSYGSRSIVMEVPLLFEKNREGYFDCIICLFSSEESTLKRALLRRNMDKKKFYAILKNQMPIEKKIHKADYLIYNISRSHLIKSLKKIIVHGRFKGNYSRYRVNRPGL